MSKHLKWIFVFAAGWVLGWYMQPQRLLPEDLPASRAAQSETLPVRAPQDSDGVADGQQHRSQRLVAPAEPGFGDVLDRHQYQDAMQLFNEQASATVRAQYRDRLVEHLNKLIKDEDYLHAEQLLSAYLKQEYRDVELLLMQAKLFRVQGAYRLAIDTLYEALAYEYRMPQIEKIREQIRNVVAQYDTELQEADEQQRRLALYQHVTLLEPDYSPYFIALARAQLSLDQADEARQSLILVESDPRVSAEARQLLGQLQDSSAVSQPGPIAIPLIREGEHFLVEAWINNAVPVRLLIDTGASMTVLKNDVLGTAGVSRRANKAVRRFNTANGTVRGLVYQVDSFSIGSQHVTDLEVAGLELSNLRSADGLLGMNYLKHFKFFIDQDKEELRLSGAM